MSSNESPEEIRRQMLGHFDAGNGAELNRHQTRRDARTKEVAEENARWSRRDTDTDITGITSDLGDIGENDSSGG